jgi:integrase
MPVRRDPRTGGWFFRTTVKTPDGRKLRLFGTPGIPGPYHDLAATKIGAQEAEQRAIKDAFAEATPAATPPVEKEVPTFGEWFNGRFWREWVVGRKNKPTEVRSKQIIYRCHLAPRFADMPIDKITVSEIAQLRADLLDAELSEKRINNVLAVLSKPLKYAVECEVIAKAPRIGMFKCERPEIEAWDFAQYARLLASAKAEGDNWYAAVCLAGEAGLRVGEVKALRWREDVDMVARTITVRQQTCNGETTTPKGRTRRTVPMTSALYEALRRMSTIREGFVIRNLDGSQKTDGEASHALSRICRRAGLPVRYWHTLRHCFGTHAALFGVNPWRLQTWMGHKRIDETMLYVHVAEAHARELPEVVRLAAIHETDPDSRIIKMLAARGSHVAADEGKSMGNPMAADRRAPRGLDAHAEQLVPRGSHVAAEHDPKTKEAAVTAA